MVNRKWESVRCENRLHGTTNNDQASDQINIKSFPTMEAKNSWDKNLRWTDRQVQCSLAHSINGDIIYGFGWESELLLR